MQSDRARTHKHCTIQLPKSPKLKPQSSKGGLVPCPNLCSTAPLTRASSAFSWRLFSSHLWPGGVHGRAIWISCQNNSHSLESLLQDPWLPVSPTPPSHRDAVLFYYHTPPHLPILASRIQKCRARITTHPLVFINNILQFPRPGAWINYSLHQGYDDQKGGLAGLPREWG